MIAKLSDVKLTMLAFVPTPPRGPEPPEATLCLFSNGGGFAAGYWVAGRPSIPTSSGLIPVLFDGPVWWAKLNDLGAIFDA